MIATLQLISLIIVVLIVIGMIIKKLIRAGKIRYIFTSPHGEKVITNWKFFDQEEYDNIRSIYEKPDEADYIITDHKGDETIISIPFILAGKMTIQRH